MQKLHIASENDLGTQKINQELLAFTSSHNKNYTYA